ncbi:MAG: hypothetical protein L0Y68_06910 [Candidatus Dadabacteria bacterium]|nr:hypothetical protein [Candidatus Dadabacteria bacterium]
MTKDNRANETKIRELIENWASAVRPEDIDGILAHHSDDIVVGKEKI